MNIRPMIESDYPLLEEFLYQAIFIPDGAEMPDRSIVNVPELQMYYKDFGKKEGDLAWVAEVEGQLVGAAWVRHIRDYGYVDDQTPSLSISLLPDYRGQGIGSQLLETLLTDLKGKQIEQVSLSVSKDNPAYQLYQKYGFKTLKENETDYVMVLKLGQADSLADKE